ncbi:MAG TPA: hypothetical protein VFU46_00240 [Gemmatimonadales bacterium]|nr:hypothetical protein [Gemmatimonadales bacterium]
MMDRQVLRPRTQVVNKLWDELRTLDRHDAHAGKVSPLYWQLKDAVGLLPKDWRIALSGTVERAR